MQKEILLELLAQNQLTCSFALDKVNAQNVRVRLNEQAASVGFIYRHIGEMMNLFGLFFGLPTPVQNTTMGQSDTGQGQDFEVSQQLVQEGFDRFRQYIETTSEEAWLDPIETPFFGTVSRVRLLGHVLFHNAHHAGQISMTLARGNA